MGLICAKIRLGNLPFSDLVPVAFLLIFTGILSAQGLENRIPEDQQPIAKVFPPRADERADPGTGKFIIFSREPVGKDWDFVARAWECIPSRPEIPVTKRIEFCHSSWNALPLLGSLVADDSHGRHPRFVELQVDSGERDYAVNLYDINYRTWEANCLWQGRRLSAFGAMGNFLFCYGSKGWMRINTVSGALSKETPFIPEGADGIFWLVRKSGEKEGCWSYDRRSEQYIAHFGPVDTDVDLMRSKLSPDGKNRALVLANAPKPWQGGKLAGKLVLQRNGERKDISVPIEIHAYAGSGIRVLAQISLTFPSEEMLQVRNSKGKKSGEDQILEIAIKTGEVIAKVVSPSLVESDGLEILDGVPVPDYLQREIRDFAYFGRGGLAPAFLRHLGVPIGEPSFADCSVGVSPDGRHIFYRGKKGPLADFYIYGDLLTKQTLYWKSPAEIGSRDAQEFVWVETPP